MSLNARATTSPIWTEVCENGVPGYYIRELILDGRTRRCEVVVMPLASDRQGIDMLICVQRHTPRWTA